MMHIYLRINCIPSIYYKFTIPFFVPNTFDFVFRLCVKTKSLDVVYQPSAVRWLTEFLCLPHKRSITYSKIEAMKSRTRKELIKNWEQILDGRVAVRKTWELQLDITAPQIFFVENFTDSNSAMAVIDFGRLQLQNNIDRSLVLANPPEFISKESEEDGKRFYIN